MAAILAFRYFQPTFKSIGLSLQEKKRKLYFQDMRPSWVSDRNIFDYCFIYKAPRCFLPSFKSIGLSVQEEKRKINFQDGCHGDYLGIPIGTILAIFDLQVTPMVPIKFRPFGSGGEAKNRFSIWPWISNWNDF